MHILGTGTRDVEILAPLKVKGALSTFDFAVTAGSPGVTGNSEEPCKLLTLI